MTLEAHVMKCWPEYFLPIERGEKTFEVRRGNDRDYRVGDRIFLQEWSPVSSEYTGHWMFVTVTYVMHGGPFLPDDMWVLGIRKEESSEGRK